MKKIFLVLLILVLTAIPLLLTACNNVSQTDKLMQGYSCDEYELFTYNVYYKGGVVGEMTMKFEVVAGESRTLPSATEEGKTVTFTGKKGTLLSTDLKVGDDVITSRVLYTNGFSPIYSYKYTFIDGVTKEMQVDYRGKYLYAKRYENGKRTAYVREKASGMYDNEMLYALVRASSVGDSSYSMSFSTVNALTAAKDNLTISKTGVTEEAIAVLKPADYVLPEGKTAFTLPCYNLRISTDNKYASTYSMTVAKARQTVKNDTIDINNVHKIITTITNGDYKYVLKDVKVV